ncbi:tetratricopeptide repeat protein [Desulfopila sp. IMCC35008]|uniref:tetratricopeptide repeat protein n=1 Tax=Desulfopila sp. IMCC35008 TaxID=2653858 RepID=UPI0013D5CAD5|nr:tetratricopeptide repeat protein [Desulfopila sp. IMCC35008]
MDVERNTGENRELIDSLKRLDLEDVPDGLTQDIMDRIDSGSGRGIMAWLREFFVKSRPVAFSFRPVYVCAVLILVCASFLAGRVSVEPQREVALAPTPQTSRVLSPTPHQTSPLAIPEDVEGSYQAYLMGRALLESEKNVQAMRMFRKASILEPDNPEYAYWEGVGYWRLGYPEKERLSYLRGLESDPRSVPLLINLAHNYLSQQEYEKALEAYSAVLTVSPDEPAALYNIGLIARQLGRIDDETAAWKAYLDVIRVGKFAYRAVERLNAYGDYSYRLYQVGVRKVILAANVLAGEVFTEADVRRELAPLATILDSDRRIQLDVVVFKANDSVYAYNRAQDLKKILVDMAASGGAERIKLSWFDEPEVVERENMQPVELNESLLIFSSVIEDKQEV